MNTLSAEDTIKLESQRVRVALQDFQGDIKYSLESVARQMPYDPQAWTELRRLVFALRYSDGFIPNSVAFPEA